MAKKRSYTYKGNDVTDTQNTAKEQPYLMPGTETYAEYERDLLSHDDTKPVDDFHVDLAKHNAEYASELTLQPHTEYADSTQGRRNYRNQMSKSTQFANVKNTAIDNALLTETLSDDAKARRASVSDLDALIYDNGVTSDEFLPKALRKYE